MCIRYRIGATAGCPSFAQFPTFGTTFTYDGDGRRVAKSDGTLYWVDDSFRPLSLGTNTGSITKDFVFLGSKRIAFVALASGNPYYYLSDHLGSTTVIGSGDGKAIESEADYFPFGNQRQIFTNLVSNLYQFTGYQYDSSSGYNYAVARFESGRLSRFLSPDPYMGSMDVRNPQSLNRYAYVMNNPIAFLDPLGLGCNQFISILVTPNGSSMEPGPVSCDGSGDFGGAGGFGHTPPSLELPPPEDGSGNTQGGRENAQQPTTPADAHDRCVEAAIESANEKASDEILNNLSKPFKSLAKGFIGGAIVGCVATLEGGCIEGAIPAALVGAFGGVLEGTGEALYKDVKASATALSQMDKDIAGCPP